MGRFGLYDRPCEEAFGFGALRHFRSQHPESKRLDPETSVMKIRCSLKSVRGRHRDNQMVRRKGRIYIINKTQKRYKARQG